MLLNKIGVKITEDKPEKLPRLNDSRRYCDYIGEARTDRSFYIHNKDISCPLAQYNLGLEKYNQKSIYDLAKTLVEWNDAATKEKALDYLKSTPTLSFKKKFISLFSLQENIYKPDIVILINTPDFFMPLLRKITKLEGKGNKYFMNGIAGMCGETTAVPLVWGQPNISLGCGGSRPHGKLSEDQLLMAVPYEEYSKLIK